MKTPLRFVFGILLGMLGASAAHATTLTLDCGVNGSNPSCGGFNYGTVTLFQNLMSPTTVTVTVSLASGDQFVTTGGPHHAFAFSLAGSPAVTITNLSAGFAATGAGSASPFGAFGYTIDCTGCGAGGSNPGGNTLTFTVALMGGGDLSIADFVKNTGGFTFAADIIQNCSSPSGGTCNGPTGSVGSDQDPGPSPTPEPSTSILLLTGAVALVLGKVKRPVAA